MAKIDELKSLLQKNNLWAKKQLGQHFLVDEKVFDRIMEAADIEPSDRVIEVGPGTGFLTEQLIKKAAQVIAVEKDPDMINLLKKCFEAAKNLNIIHADALKFAIPEDLVAYKVVANIPYYITSPLLKHFLRAKSRPERMVLLIQREVAEKVCGISGKSLITIETQLFGQPELVATVPPSAFYPPPKVESAILKIDVYKKPLIPESQMRDFLRVVQFGFSQKRKKLSNTLGAGLHIKPSEMAEILKKSGIDPNLRAEHLEIDDWKRLAKTLRQLSSILPPNSSP